MRGLRPALPKAQRPRVSTGKPSLGMPCALDGVLPKQSRKVELKILSQKETCHRWVQWNSLPAFLVKGGSASAQKQPSAPERQRLLPPMSKNQSNGNTQIFRTPWVLYKGCPLFLRGSLLFFVPTPCDWDGFYLSWVKLSAPVLGFDDLGPPDPNRKDPHPSPPSPPSPPHRSKPGATKIQAARPRAARALLVLP